MESTEKVSHVFIKTLMDKGRKITSGTVTDLYITIKKINEYYPGLRVKDLKRSLIQDFDSRLYNEGYMPNTVWKHHKNLKSLIHSSDLHLSIPDPYHKFTIQQYPGEKVTIQESEIALLEAVELPESLDVYRLLFLVGYYTLLRVSDLKTLNGENLIERDGRKFIHMITQKTGATIMLPAPDKVIKIMKKFKEYQFPREYQIKSGIKEVFLRAGITRKVPVVVYSIVDGNLEKNISYRPVYEMVTIHSARRAGITAMMKNKIPTRNIMLMSGHKTEVALLAYVGITQEENAIEMYNHKFFQS